MTVGVDSWVTLDEANTYLSTRLGAGKWFTLPDTGADPRTVNKTLYLVSAYRLILSNTAFRIPVNTTDPNVKMGQIEAAYFLQNYYMELEARDVAQAAGLKQFTFTQRTESFGGDAPRLPRFVLDYFAAYSSIGGDFVDLTR